MRVGARWIGLFLVVSFAGCGKAPAPPAATDNSVPETAPVAAEDPFASLGESEQGVRPPATRPSATDSPDAAIRAAIAGLEQNRPQDTWEFLPASYQTDLEELIHEFGNRMDPEIWTKGFAVAQKLVDVLQQKKSLILTHPLVKANQQAMTPEDLSRNWDGLTQLLKLLVHSELSDLEKVRTLDVESLLAESGSRFTTEIQELARSSANNPFDRLFNAEISTVSQDGDTAVVRLTVPGEPPQQYDYVRVDGKWIPKRLAEGWDDAMHSARERLAQFDPKAQKEAVLARLEAVDQGLDQLAAAETPEQFNQLVFPVIMPLLAARANSQAIQANAALVQINRELNPQQQDAVLAALEKLADNPEQATVSLTVAGARTVVKVSPVTNLQALADAIMFGEVIDVDEQRRTIAVRMTE